MPPALKPLKMALSSACAVLSAALTTAARSRTAPREALSSSMIGSSNGTRTSITGATSRTPHGTPRPPSFPIVRRPVLTAAYCHPCGPSKSTSLRPARLISRTRLASASICFQASGVIGAWLRFRRSTGHFPFMLPMPSARAAEGAAPFVPAPFSMPVIGCPVKRYVLIISSKWPS